jgi:hypothetical protein
MIKKTSQKEKQTAAAIDYRNEERRKVPARGFTYVSAVGWICRRERCRREGDRFGHDQPPPICQRHL